VVVTGDPQLHRFVRSKFADPDGWLEGMRRLQAHAAR
jgi:hypothetical protein